MGGPSPKEVLFCSGRGKPFIYLLSTLPLFDRLGVCVGGKEGEVGGVVVDLEPRFARRGRWRGADRRIINLLKTSDRDFARIFLR